MLSTHSTPNMDLGYQLRTSMIQSDPETKYPLHATLIRVPLKCCRVQDWGSDIHSGNGDGTSTHFVFRGLQWCIDCTFNGIINNCCLVNVFVPRFRNFKNERSIRSIPFGLGIRCLDISTLNGYQLYMSSRSVVWRNSFRWRAFSPFSVWVSIFKGILKMNYRFVNSWYQRSIYSVIGCPTATQILTKPCPISISRLPHHYHPPWMEIFKYGVVLRFDLTSSDTLSKSWMQWCMTQVMRVLPDGENYKRKRHKNDLLTLFVDKGNSAFFLKKLFYHAVIESVTSFVE